MNTQKPEFLYELTSEEKESVRFLIDQLPHLKDGIMPADSEAISRVKEASDDLPKGLKRALDTFATNGNRWGSLLIRNLPADTDLPDTPGDGKPVEKPTSYSEYRLMMALQRTGGVPYADMREKNGMLVHQVCPRRGMEMAQENGGSSAFFELHTENTFLPEKMIPGIFGLTCVRPGHDGGAPTMSMSLENARKYLSEADIEILSQPRFLFHYATSYGQPGRMTEPRVVIHPSNRMTVDFADMSIESHPGVAIEKIADVPEARALLNLKEALIKPDVALSVDWQAGDVVLLDNLAAVHARKGFVAKHDGRDRWLQRMFSITPENFRATKEYRPIGSHVYTLA